MKPAGFLPQSTALGYNSLPSTVPATHQCPRPFGAACPQPSKPQPRSSGSSRKHKKKQGGGWKRVASTPCLLHDHEKDALSTPCRIFIYLSLSLIPQNLTPLTPAPPASLGQCSASAVPSHLGNQIFTACHLRLIKPQREVTFKKNRPFLDFMGI